MLEAILFDEGSGEVGGVGFSIGVGDVLFGQGVGVAFYLRGREIVEW